MKANSMKAISLFDNTGSMLKPWHEAEYECHLFDLQHKRGSHLGDDGIYRHGYDLSQLPLALLELLDGQIAFVSCFPPCTDVSLSGAKHMAGKGLRALSQSIQFFATSAEFCRLAKQIWGARYMIENPMSTISTYWRPPDHKFHPCHYSGYVDGAENYTKETWLWVDENGFVMPPRRMYGDLFEMPDSTYIHNQPPGPERMNIRSATPAGFARAVFESNNMERRAEDKALEIVGGMHCSQEAVDAEILGDQ